MRPLRVGLGAALSILLLGACGGGTASIHESATTATASTTTTTSSAPPTSVQVAAEIAATHQVSDPNEKFAGGHLVTVSDGHGGYLTAVSAARFPGDGHGMLVFFWHNQTFLGWDTDEETWTVSLSAKGANVIDATYADYAPKDPACCPSLAPVTITYRWDGTRLSQSQTLPSEALLNTLVELAGS